MGCFGGGGELGGIRLATLLITIEIHSRSLNILKHCRHFSSICLMCCLLSSLHYSNLAHLTQKIWSFFHEKLYPSAQDISVLHWVEGGRFSLRPASHCIANTHMHTYFPFVMKP